MKVITKTIEVEDVVFEIGDIVDIKGYGRYVFIRVPRNKDRYAFINLASGFTFTKAWKTKSTCQLNDVYNVTDWVCVGNLKNYHSNIPFTYGDKYW